MQPTKWTEIKVAEDATPFKERFVVFRSDLIYKEHEDLNNFLTEEGDMKVGYVNHSMCGWATHPREEGYSMSLFVNNPKKSSRYAQVALINSNLKTANLSFRFLTPDELERIYMALFWAKTGTMNNSIGGIYLISIKDQLRNEGSDIELPYYNEYLHQYTDKSLWDKYEDK